MALDDFESSSSVDSSSVDTFLNDVSEAFVHREDAALVAVDPVTTRMIALMDSVASTPATVLLSGESGVGKEVFARYIHRRSKREKSHFVAINCAAVAASLLESELFGHERGAFSGAISTHQGVFERAHGGTLLLDEVSEMPLELQVKLLRVIQERQVQRVGGTRTIDIDIRIIATTNRDLMKYVDEGKFRRDLYYRLSVFPITVPPLRDRPAEIIALVKHYVKELSVAFDQPVSGITSAAQKRLMSYAFPGNVRELVNIVQRAIIICPRGGVIDAEHIVFENTPEVLIGVRHLAEKVDDADDSSQMKFEIGKQPLTEIRRNIIVETIRHFHGNRSKAAEVLGISTRTIRNKLKQYREMGIDLSGVYDDDSEEDAD